MSGKAKVVGRRDQREESQENSSRAEQACPECNGRLRTARNETVCSDCGLVVDENLIDHGPEWRAYTQSDQDERSRVGSPVTNLIHDKGMSTNIGWQDRDANGNTITGKKKAQLERLRKWQRRIRADGSRERNLQQALGELKRMASALGIPEDVQEIASVIYRRAINEDLLVGRSIEGMVSGALYAACRKEGLPRSLDDFTTVSRVERKEIGRDQRYLVRELSLEVSPPRPENHLVRYASTLDLSEDVVQKAETIIEQAREAGIVSGCHPVGFAGAALYLAGLLCEEKRTQAEVAEATDMTDRTIRQRYHDQAEVLGLQ